MKRFRSNRKTIPVAAVTREVDLPNRTARPSISAEITALIERLAAENTGWGYQRIQASCSSSAAGPAQSTIRPVLKALRKRHFLIRTTALGGPRVRETRARCDYREPGSRQRSQPRSAVARAATLSSSPNWGGLSGPAPAGLPEAVRDTVRARLGALTRGGRATLRLSAAIATGLPQISDGMVTSGPALECWPPGRLRGRYG